jgi:DNA-binding SARP family transcriptional activator
MQFRILGPLEVIEDGHRLPLGGRKQRALLAVLLLHPNEVVPADRLIDEVWGEGAPETVANALQVHVSRLRRALGADAVVTQSPGYLLRVQRDALDAERFERLVREGRDALAAGDAVRASATLETALGLWRGRALVDFAYDSFAQAAIGRLEEFRVAALEDRLDADLALGRHLRLIAELEALVAEHPLRERPRGQLMLALYRSGRQAEALAAYQEARRVLVDELGIEPSRALHELEAAILNQDPALDARPKRIETESPTAARAGFVGRERELAALESALEDTLGGHGRLVLLSGEPGIGKSRLTDELAGRARERGARVLVGRCWEAGGAPAYWPWVQSIRSYLRDADPSRLREQLGRGAGDLAQIVPELRTVLPDLPEPHPLDPEAARFRLFDATATFLRAASAEQPIVLVLDDLQAADTPSLLLLQFVAGEPAQSRVLVVVAYRDVQPALAEPLASALSELTRQHTTVSVQLSGLTESEVAGFLAHALGHEPQPALVAAIHRETDGNPLFVGELVRLLAAEGRLEDDGDLSSLPIPHGVRAVIGRRLHRLSKECVQALSVASVLGREFGLDALAALTDTEGEALLDLLDETIAERVVIEAPGAPGRLRFAHALVRDALYEELTAAQRVRLHRRAGEALEELYAHDPDPHLAELAHHFFAAAPAGSAGKAADYARRAADRALRLLAYEEAIRLYRDALEAWSLAGGPAETRSELLLALGDAQARAGDGPAAKATFLEAAAAAKALGVAEHMARAALGYGGRFLWARAGGDRRLVPLLDDALVALGDGDSALRVRVLARLAGALRDEPLREPRAALSREAVEMARRIGDPNTLAFALDGRYAATFWPENPEERLEIASELARLAERADDVERAVQGRYYRVMTLLELGDVRAAVHELEATGALAAELGQPAQLWLLEATRATVALFAGRFDDAETLVPSALELGRRAQSSDAVLSYRVQLFTLRMQRGPLAEVEDLLHRSIQEYPARPMFRCMLAYLYARLGRDAEARTEFADLAADRFAAIPLTNEWLFSMGFLAEVAAELGEVAHATAIYELLRPYEARNASTGDYIATGSVARPLGVLAAAASRWAEAEEHFERALELDAGMGARPWVAHGRLAYARMLLSRDGPDDRSRAREQLRAALAEYRELGMEAWADAAAALGRLEPAAARPR